MYAHPEMLVSTQWAADHLSHPDVRFIEAGFNSQAYDSGHVPGAIFWAWGSNVLRAGSRDILSKTELETQMSRAGIASDTTVVIYDGSSNLLAAMALWLLEIYGHRHVCLLDGNREKWASENRPLTTDIPEYRATAYQASAPDLTLRAHREYVQESVGRSDRVLIDTRTTSMYAGDDAMGGTVGGHIPGAVNVPAKMEMDNGQFRRWALPTTHADGTFRSSDELRALFEGHGISPDKSVITYCVRGGLSTHMWFVLKYLLGYPDVREYDGSWAEWGNLIGVPVERVAT